MECPQCRNVVKPTALFCHRCGRRLVDRPDATSGLNVHDTQPVAPVPAPLSSEALAQVIAAETREFSFTALAPVAPSGTAPVLTEGSRIGEHYRVVRVIEQAPDGPLYEVVDMWAQERCWACGALWNDGDDEHYCVQCGAERHSKALFLRAQQVLPEMFTEAATIAPNAIIDGDQMYIIVPEEDISVPPRPLPRTFDVAYPNESLQHNPNESMVAHPHESVEQTLQPASTYAYVETTQQLDLPLSLSPSADDPGEWGPSTSDQFDPPTVEARYFEVTALLPGFTPRWEMRLGLMSDVGRSRRGRPNEDSCIALHLAYAGDSVPPPLTLCVVADGLGGHEDGQRAGRLAARIIARHVVQQLWLPSLAGEAMPSKDPGELGAVLRAAILDANAQILKLNRTENGDMGCTATALIAQGDAACVANVGDSRTYFFDGHELSRMTTDHSLVARLVAAGMLTPDEVYTHPQRSQIYRSLGDEGDLQVDLFPHRLRVGETFVLCSDGLWEMVRDPDIHHLLSHAVLGDPHALAQQLVMLANEHGGDDNVSVLVAQVVA